MLNNKKKMIKSENICSSGFGVQAEQRVKTKESGNIDKYLDLARELKRKKLWNMKSTVIPIVVGSLRVVPKRLLKWTGRIGN